MMQEKKIAEGSFEVTRCLGKTLKKKKKLGGGKRDQEEFILHKNETLSLTTV
jgi:hypothetical protein